MGVSAALIGLIAAALGVVGGYVLGYRRTRYERLYEQRVAVIAELSQLLWGFQQTALLATNPGQPPSIRLNWTEQNRRALTDLHHSLFANTVWLPEPITESIALWMGDTTDDKLRIFHNDLNSQGNPSTQAGADAAAHIFNTVPEARREIEGKFRALLYPEPWYERPLRLLVYLDRRHWLEGARDE